MLTVRILLVFGLSLGLVFSSSNQIYIGPMDMLLALALVFAKECSFKSARSPLLERFAWTWRYLARLSAAISSASSICFLKDFTFPWSWSIRACILSAFFLSSS